MEKERSLNRLQAGVCKLLSHSKRIEIINALKEGEMMVNELASLLDTPKSNMSQHLALMKNKRLVKSRRDGINIYYRIAHSRVSEVCAVMREVLAEMPLEKAKTSAAGKGD